jgi:ATP-binding cassette subfamily C protein LapB
MKELLRRLTRRPVIFAELLTASLFVNVLSLATPLFVIQVLNRYVGYGFDGTLITLTLGMLLALVLLVAFRILRTRLASTVSLEPDRELADRVQQVVLKGKSQSIQRVSPPERAQMLTRLQTIQSAYDAANINAVLDLPFFILFLGATFMLSGVLALITLVFMLGVVASGLAAEYSMRGDVQKLQEASGVHRSNMLQAMDGTDTVRAFGGAHLLERLWPRQAGRLRKLRYKLSNATGSWQSANTGLGMLMRVAIYVVGARQVVAGDLTVGGLIGASILGSKAFELAGGFVRSHQVLAKAQEAKEKLHDFLRMPVEQDTGTALASYSGRLELKDLGFIHPGQTSPLFESVDLTLEPGNILFITGPNGSGKTTLARIIVGLLDPSRGHVLADGVELRQIAKPWWRRQLMYLPQEPAFLNVSIRENILMAAPQLDNQQLNAVIRQSGLRDYLDVLPKGLETGIVEGGNRLPLGIRRRLALARALATSGRLLIMDEPSEGLDAQGRQAVNLALKGCIGQGRTVIILSTEPGLEQVDHIRLDLSSKPRPRPEFRKAVQPPADTQGENEEAQGGKRDGF